MSPSSELMVTGHGPAGARPASTSHGGDGAQPTSDNRSPAGTGSRCLATGTMSSRAAPIRGSHGHAWDPVAYAAHASFVPALGAPVVELLAPQRSERILDLGCGDGQLTEQLAAAGAEVVGVDADPAMVAAARARGLDVRLVDGCALTFDSEFDAVFTNAALHWMPAPARVAAGVWRALKPGGRYVGEFGGHGNIAAIRVAVHAVLAARGYHPPGETSFYPTAAEYRVLLESVGFTVGRADLIPRPTPLPSGMGAWLETFRAGFIDAAGVAATERAAVIGDICELLRPALADQQGNWTADYVRMRFAATRPA